MECTRTRVPRARQHGVYRVGDTIGPNAVYLLDSNAWQLVCGRYVVHYHGLIDIVDGTTLQYTNAQHNAAPAGLWGHVFESFDRRSICIGLNGHWHHMIITLNPMAIEIIDYDKSEWRDDSKIPLQLRQYPINFGCDLTYTRHGVEFRTEFTANPRVETYGGSPIPLLGEYTPDGYTMRGHSQRYVCFGGVVRALCERLGWVSFGELYTRCNVMVRDYAA